MRKALAVLLVLGALLAATVVHAEHGTIDPTGARAMRVR
jgi:hypothetical protein